MEIILNGLESGADNPVVSVVIHPAGGRQVWIAISDNGPGFTEESVRRAGTPFYTTKSKGVGLGLHVARRIIEAHAGRLLLPDTATAGELVSPVVRILLPTE
jgi:nitrogen fixation/metabolism regulation signal transduction histidine kinase